MRLLQRLPNYSHTFSTLPKFQIISRGLNSKRRVDVSAGQAETLPPILVGILATPSRPARAIEQKFNGPVAKSAEFLNKNTIGPRLGRSFYGSFRKI